MWHDQPHPPPLEFSKKLKKELAAYLKSNESRPIPHAAMTTDTTATYKNTAQEGPTYGGHVYYRYEN